MLAHQQHSRADQEVLTSRASDLLESFLTAAGSRGERAVAWVRLFLAALAFVRMLAISWEGVAAGEIKYLFMSSFMIAAAGFSVWALIYLRHHRADRWELVLSVAIDAILCFGAVGGGVVWPAEDYLGALRMPALTIFVLAVVAAGFRLSTWAVVVSAILNGASLAAFVVMDRLWHEDLIRYEVYDAALWGIFVCGAAFIGGAISVRTVALVRQGVRATLEGERTRQRLGAYVSEVVADHVLAEQEVLMGGQRRDIAVLFSDLRNFTRYGKSLSPEELVAELNEYLDAMVKVIRAEGGVVDKYMGDAIMVVFGVPTTTDDDAARALRTAAAMQAALVELNASREARELPPFVQGIGVHFGSAVAGNIGTRGRLQYTVVGDAVNLASRLEAATKEHKVPVLVSQTVVDAAAQSGLPCPSLVKVGSTALRSYDEPVAVFTLADESPAN